MWSTAGGPQKLTHHYGPGSAEATSKATETLDLRGNTSPCQQKEQAVASFTGQPWANAKAEYKVASRAAHKSALADYQCAESGLCPKPHCTEGAS